MGGARQEGGAYTGRGGASAVRVGEVGLIGAGPEAGRRFGQVCARRAWPGRGPAEPGVPPGGKNLRARGSRLSAPIGVAAPGTSARPCVFPVNMAAPSRVRCGRVYLRWRRRHEARVGEVRPASGSPRRTGGRGPVAKMTRGRASALKAGAGLLRDGKSWWRWRRGLGESGWGLLLGRREGLLTLGKGPVGMKGKMGPWLEEMWAAWFGVMRGRRACLKRHLLSRPPGVGPFRTPEPFSGDHPLPQQVLAFFATVGGEPGPPGAAVFSWRCPQPPRIARQEAARLLRGRLGPSPPLAKPPRPAADGHGVASWKSRPTSRTHE